jgi:hypothetical protein
MTKWAIVVGGAIAIAVLESALGITYPNFLAGAVLKFAVMIWAFLLHERR